ncbi:MAG TPA: hypothetical protein VFA87_12305, partial [Rhizomicrobium sp.]|nr:hypothetical protein [Rhizomicrobium sp.]
MHASIGLSRFGRTPELWPALDQEVWHRRSVQPFAVWLNGFTSDELDAIVAHGEALAREKATIEDRGRLEISDSVR